MLGGGPLERGMFTYCAQFDSGETRKEGGA